MIPNLEKRIEIRPMTTVEEMRGVEKLQKEVWRVPEIEVVPYSHLIAAVTAGGVLLGAFDKDQLIGFVYGFVSYEKGQMAHHSHMLAVRNEYRNYKLGEKLKKAQREVVLRQGISIMSWTFDPLQSLNAYFNFNKLGVVSDTYFIDFYGDEAPSFLHRNSTDRLWVRWNLKDETAHQTEPPINFEKVKRLVELGENGLPQLADLKDLRDQEVAIVIPAEINKMQAENIDLAVEWRKATRAAFIEAFEQGT